MQPKKKIAALLATFALVLGGAISPALADESKVETYQKDKIYITKQVKTVLGQEDVVTAKGKYTFNVEEFKTETDAEKGDYPKVTVSPITVGNETELDSENYIYYYGQGQVDLSKFTDTTKPGLYAYKITENAIEGNNWKNNTEGVKSYILRVYVDQNHKVKVTVQKENGKKVDPSQKKETDKWNEVTSKGATFKNEYNTKNDDLTADTTSLKIMKNADPKNYGDKGQKFEVEIWLHKPGEDLTKLDLQEDKYIADGENGDTHIVLENLPVGTTYKIVEKGTTNWKATKASVVVAGANAVDVNAENSEAGADWTLAEDAARYVAVKSGESTEGTVDNTVTIFNEYEDVNITGLVINNAPFVLMIGIPVVAGAVWVARRRSAQN